MDQLKKDQVAPIQANNWIENLTVEKTFNLIIPEIILQKSTCELLANNNLFRIRVKLGLEPVDNTYQICAFALSSAPNGSCNCGFIDNVTPVYKLTPQNEDYSQKPAEVEEAVNLWKSWRLGEIGDGTDAPARQYIYPISYLLTKFELNEIFLVEGKDIAQIGFGITKSFNPMIYSGLKGTANNGDDTVFDFSQPCPPYCND
ncbi:MAG: hypothetical protein JXR31_10930 [Prolixibacteraceae bacterium]|nr:hypothetical protein [Prolixibacteraceae bacterium]MBN2774755.1 hypothetical protein [Prolixibacteraceae bacterium]